MTLPGTANDDGTIESFSEDEPTDGVISCARCGQDHECTWKRIERPIYINDRPVKWWALCSNSGDPILAGIVPYATVRRP